MLNNKVSASEFCRVFFQNILSVFMGCLGGNWLIRLVGLVYAKVTKKRGQKKGANINFLIGLL